MEQNVQPIPIAKLCFLESAFCFLSSKISLSPSPTRNSINLWHKFSSWLDLNESFACFLEEIEKEIRKVPCGRSYDRLTFSHSLWLKWTSTERINRKRWPGKNQMNKYETGMPEECSYIHFWKRIFWIYHIYDCCLQSLRYTITCMVELSEFNIFSDLHVKSSKQLFSFKLR